MREHPDVTVGVYVHTGPQTPTSTEFKNLSVTVTLSQKGFLLVMNHFLIKKGTKCINNVN